MRNLCTDLGNSSYVDHWLFFSMWHAYLPKATELSNDSNS